MANRQRAEARRKAAAKAAGGGSKKLGMWVVVGVVVVLAIAGMVVATGGKDSPASNGTTPDGSAVTTAPSGVPDSQKVTVTGDPLPDFQTTGTDKAVGLTAPALDGLNFSNQPVKVEPGKGAYMLVFLAHWCPHCNVEVPRLLDWKHSGQVPTGLNVIGIATAVSKTSVNYPPGTWFSNKGWEWPVLVDESHGDGAAGTAAVAYGATGWPYMVIVGADGKVKARLSGEVQIADLQKIVDQALAG